MQRRTSTIDKVRYILLAVLAVAVVVCAVLLWRQRTMPLAPPEPMAVEAAANGTVRIDGVVYATPETLKAKITEMQAQHPGAGFTINAPHGGDLANVARAVILMKQSGATAVWVVNEPATKQEPH
jgi:hypothetical protein